MAEKCADSFWVSLVDDGIFAVLPAIVPGAWQSESVVCFLRHYGNVRSINDSGVLGGTVTGVTKIDERPVTRRRIDLRVLGALVLILVLAAYLRWLPISDGNLDGIISGDAREYQSLAEFFVDRDSQLPPDRYPGYPYLLAGLFAVLPFAHDTVQIATSMVLGVLVIALVYVLAAPLVGRGLGVGVATLAAIQPEMVDNAHRGMSEELFLTCLLLLLILFRRIYLSTSIGWGGYSILGLLCGAVALVRPDGAYVFVPIFLGFLWRERAQGIGRLVQILPILVLPLALPVLSRIWTESLGIYDMNMRLGRVILWMEFMLGRMPYSYTFYKETHVNEWLWEYHSLAELVILGMKSSIRNLLALGEAIWGQVALLLAMVGAATYVREHRDWALPLAVPLVVLPQWGIVTLWMEADVERYSIRAVPMLLILLALGARQAATWTRVRFSLDGVVIRWLPAGFALLSLAPALLPFSLYASVRPNVYALITEREEYLPKSKKIHPQLVATWQEFVKGRMPIQEAEEKAMRLLARHDAYAPTHFVLAILSLTQGQRAEAIESLERAVEIVPFFAEAAVMLAELYAIEQRCEEALALLEQTAVLRSDYPLVELMRGHLNIMTGDMQSARTAYMEYLRLNRHQHERTFVRHERIMKRKGVDTTKLHQIRAALQADASGLTSPLLWDYLSLDLDGIKMAPPADQTLYLNLGVCDLLAGDVNAARQHWMAMTRLMPTHAHAWANLGTLLAVGGHHEQARTSWAQALSLAPENAIARDGLRQLETATFSAETARYEPIRVVLPLTGAHL